VQTLLTSAKSLVSGLEQIEDEVRVLRKTGVTSGDRFIFVMKVRYGPVATEPRGYSPAPTQPFLQDARRNVNALNNMATALESELRSLFVYYGESTETAEGMKAEDFFRMILSFATSLQVSTNLAVAPDPRLTP
jgi:diaphanous 1